MSQSQALAGAFLEQKPRAVLERRVGYLVGSYKAKGAAVLAVDGEAAVLVNVYMLRAEVMLAALERWGLLLERLRGGEVIAADDFLMAPLASKGRFVGALYLDAPEAFVSRGFEQYLFQMGKTLASALSSPPPATLSVRFDERRVLQASLQANEWNISRVARELGKTRRTIYLWMRAFGLERPAGRKA